MDLSNLKAAEGSVHSDNFRRGRGHAVELCQRHHAERTDVFEIVGFVFSQRRF